MRCRTDSLCHNVYFLLFAAAVLLFAATPLHAAEVPVLKCGSVSGGAIDFRAAGPEVPQAKFPSEPAVPDVIQNRPFQVPANVLMQRYRNRSSVSANSAQLFVTAGMQGNLSDPVAYLSSIKDQNFVLSPITCVKITHKRE